MEMIVARMRTGRSPRRAGMAMLQSLNYLKSVHLHGLAVLPTKQAKAATDAIPRAHKVQLPVCARVLEFVRVHVPARLSTYAYTHAQTFKRTGESLACFD